jgi:large subunit ribosomal protein L29
MKMNEIKALKDEELVSELERVRRHLFDLRSQSVTEKLEDPSMLKRARTDIARILTEMRQRELQAATAEASNE